MVDRTKIRITAMLSGNGTNFQAVIDAINDKTLSHCEIVRVVSNRKDAFGLVRAAKAAPPIPTHYHNLVKYKKRYPEDVEQARSEYDKDLAEIVLADEPQFVVALGWMHILAHTFLDPLQEAGIPVINLHPALPGLFNGANAIERQHRAWLDGKIDKMGIMIHHVIAEVDEGEPILVEEIPFIKGEDEDIKHLEQRVHEREHLLVVKGVSIVVERLRKLQV